MTKQAGDVSRFLQELDHPLKATIVELRDAILASNDQITESIKWKAPNFRYRGDDRVTFNLRPHDRVQLIFHRGVTVKDTADFTFTDSSGLLVWAAPDRAILSLAPDEATAQRDAIVRVVNEWMDATTAPPA